jgi:hypothetical protein
MASGATPSSTPRFGVGEVQFIAQRPEDSLALDELRLAHPIGRYPGALQRGFGQRLDHVQDGQRCPEAAGQIARELGRPPRSGRTIDSHQQRIHLASLDFRRGGRWKRRAAASWGAAALTRAVRRADVAPRSGSGAGFARFLARRSA